MRDESRLLKPITIGVAAIVVLLLVFSLFKSIPVGHVGVATLFGRAHETPYEPGLHFPVNPLYSWTLFDTRQQTHKETVGVPSGDQLTTMMDISVQYRLIASQAPRILMETGTAEQITQVHLIPKLRSLAREQGKSVARAEEFFKEEVQRRLQQDLHEALKTFMLPRGVDIQEVLLRDVELPRFILAAIQEKKVREQEAEKQKAELERFRTEQEQKVAAAAAERRAAEEEAQKLRTLADAKAYEIQKINEAIARNPGYVQLQALEALKAIAKDPAAKVYFINGDSPQPLPLMHMGEAVGGNK